MEFIIIVGIVCAIIGTLIAQNKNRSGLGGGAWGCLLGPIGVLVVALMPKKVIPVEHTIVQTQPPSPLKPQDSRPTKTCPYCAETILEAAQVCRFCQREV